MGSGHYPPPRLLLLLLSAFTLFAKCVANVECLPGQSSLLLHLKEGFSFPSYELASWKPGSNCCNWEGVTCDSESGWVTGLDLSSRNISGKIGSSLFNLTSLQTLNLSYNQFDPIPIPSGFGRLANLTCLNLSHAGFVGQIPIGIPRLTRLVSLDISTCDDFYDMPSKPLQLQNPNLQTLIRNLSNLKELHLDCAVLFNEAEWCRAVSMSVPRLQVLSLQNCNLSGPIDSLSRLRSLSVIRLGFNNLNSKVPEHFANLSSLGVLSLRSCMLKGLFPKSIFQLRSLRDLDVSDNPMLFGSLSDFPKDNALRNLVLPGTNFSGNLPESVGNLKSLKVLDLAFNSFSGVIPVCLFHLPALQILHLSYNQLSGKLGEFSNSSHLSGNQLEGQIPRSLFQLSRLRYILLGWNNFNGTMELELFASLKNLSALSLANNRLSVRDGDGNSSLSFPKIRYLVLASCNLTKLPALLRYQLDQMRYLDLSNNRIGGEIPKWIWSTGSLYYLNLSYNLFTHVEGPDLPNFLSNSTITLDLQFNSLQGSIPLPPTYAYFLDYSNNNFSSIIPSNISFYLNSTVLFSLANNSLTGEIPPSICNARFLQILDFSDNFLNGSIPPCLLEGGDDLTVLNLKGNQLQGTIPQNISEGCVLRTINLNGNHLEGRVPRSLANCNQLEVIDLGNNHMVDSFPFWLGNISALQILVLRSNGFYGPVKPPRGSNGTNYTFSKLQIFDLSSNHFNGSISSKCFYNLEAMMVNSQLNCSTLGFTAYLPSQGNFYQDTVIVTIKGRDITLVKILTIFTYIDFSNNDFEGDIPEVIGELQSLYVLNFSHNALTGQIPPTVGKLKQLESLDLSGNHLSGEIPQELTSLTFLSFLNLSNNNLIGRIPQGNQFSTFSNTSFEGNEGLCGSPLSKQCSNAGLTSTGTEPPPSESDHSHDKSTYVIGLALFIGLGFGVGIAVVFVLQNVSRGNGRRRSSGC